MLTEYKYSEHYFISEATYQHKDTSKVKLLYSGRTGEVVPLSLPDCELVVTKSIPEVHSELFNALKEAEIIIDLHTTDMESIIKRNLEGINNPTYLDFVILPTSFCNMGCSYCGQSHLKGAMDVQMIDQVIHRVSTAIQSNSVKGVLVSWFGGEPLVGFSKILKISEALVTITKQSNIKYYAKITTNGSLLTLEKLMTLHEECCVEEINITFDGPEIIHDQRRFLKNGKKSFTKVVKLLQEALKEPRLKRLKYVFRTNIDKENEAYIEEYLQQMHDYGFADHRIGYELVGVYPWSNDVSSVELQKARFAESEVKWMMKLLELRMQYTYLLKTTKITCVAVTPYAEVIASNGKIFTCTEHPLVPRHEATDFVSHVTQNWENRKNIGQFDTFNEKILAKKLPCSSCKLLGVCGGACPKHWEEGYIPCPSIKFNLQQRLNIVAVTMGYRVVQD